MRPFICKACDKDQHARCTEGNCKCTHEEGFPKPDGTRDSEAMRARVVHGWAFRGLHPDVVESVWAYLADGDPSHLYATAYRPIRDGMYRRGDR